MARIPVPTVAERDWAAGLPTPVLGLISERLTISDVFCCLYVCKTWYAELNTNIAAGHYLPRLPQSPFLASFSTYSEFFSISDGRHFFGIACPGDLLEKHVVGSGHGWLVLAYRNDELSLFQPFTATQLSLPPASTFPTRIREINQVLRITDAIKKVAISSSPSSGGDCIVAVLWCTGSDIHFARPGDAEWKQIKLSFFYKNIFFLNSHTLAALTNRGAAGMLIYDLSSMEAFLCCISGPETLSLHPVFGSFKSYTTVCGSEVLRVEKFSCALHIKVEKLVRIEQSNCWRETKDLKGRALFLNEHINDVLCLKTKDIPELKENCVYLVHRSGELGRTMVVIYHLQTGRIEMNSIEGVSLLDPPPMWFTPSLV